jgi:hypothetical protein
MEQDAAMRFFRKNQPEIRTGSAVMNGRSVPDCLDSWSRVHKIGNTVFRAVTGQMQGNPYNPDFPDY